MEADEEDDVAEGEQWMNGNGGGHGNVGRGGGGYIADNENGGGNRPGGGGSGGTAGARNFSGSLIDFFETVRRGARGERARTSEENQPLQQTQGVPQSNQDSSPGSTPSSGQPGHLHRASSMSNSVAVGRTGGMNSPVQRSGSVGAGGSGSGS